jgi:signal transduction histidine kinase
MDKQVQRAWLFAAAMVALYATGTLLLGRGFRVVAFGDAMQCLVGILLVVAAGSNVRRGTPEMRKFWLLMTISFALWGMGQFVWTYYEVFLRAEYPQVSAWDALYFLKGIPLLAALGLQPHREPVKDRPNIGLLDLSIIVLWFVYLYFFFVTPWQYINLDAAEYGVNFAALQFFENLIFVALIGTLWLQASSGWRTLYRSFFAASALYLVASQAINVAITHSAYYTGSYYDLPLVASVLWFGVAAWSARWENLAEQRTPPPAQLKGLWPARLAMVATASIPIMGVYTMFGGYTPHRIVIFRLELTFAAMLGLTSLLFWKQTLVDRSLLYFLQRSEDSIDDLKRLQSHAIQSEKMVALGQLVAGAAHEMNNPLTSILGYSDLLANDPALAPAPREMAGKIGNQARRTRRLVQNLLSFAQQSPGEKKPVNINALITNAVQLRELDLSSHKIELTMQLEETLPGVSGDPNLLLQVIFHLLNNAVDALSETGGGKVMLHTYREQESVYIEIADNGPGIKDPGRVFDPFYTTKPVGKGTGLGLSATYGIIQDHQGQITCHNRLQGGAVFLIRLPALAEAATDPNESVRMAARD